MDQINDKDSEGPITSSPRKDVVETPAKKEESINSKTLPSFSKDEEEVGNMQFLNDVVQKLLEEKEELRSKLMEQDKRISEMQRKSQCFEEELPGRTEKIEKIEKSEKIEKPKTRPPKPRVPSTQETKLKARHENERAKLAIIEEKLENARKKRLEQVKSKAVQKPRRISEAQARLDSRDNISKPMRLKTAVSPVPKTIIISETPKKQVKEENDRQNLDTAGTSNFIYPDSEGNFMINDEIDKFVTNYEKRGSPLLNYNSPYRNTPVVENEVRFTFTSMNSSVKRDIKPLVANKSGFPNDIFRLP